MGFPSLFLTIVASAPPVRQDFVDSRLLPKTGVNLIVVARSHICESVPEGRNCWDFTQHWCTLDWRCTQCRYRFAICLHLCAYWVLRGLHAVYRLPMALLWHGVMPVLTRILGYFPARSFRFGEDIPAGSRCNGLPDEVPNSVQKPQTQIGNRANAMIARYPSVHGRALAIGFTDDAFATPAGTKRLLRTFPAVHATSILIAPDHASMASIGHFGFFRRSAEAHLWPFVVNFLRTR